VRISNDESTVALQASELEPKDDHFEVFATAERLLDHVNGALFRCCAWNSANRMGLPATPFPPERGATTRYASAAAAAALDR
jgi:hypothetical protein